MPNPIFPVADHPFFAEGEALRQAIENGLAARKGGATASEINRLLKTLDRLGIAARNVPKNEIEVFTATGPGPAAFNAALLATA